MECFFIDSVALSMNIKHVLHRWLKGIHSLGRQLLKVVMSDKTDADVLAENSGEKKETLKKSSYCNIERE